MDKARAHTFADGSESWRIDSDASMRVPRIKGVQTHATRREMVDVHEDGD